MVGIRNHVLTVKRPAAGSYVNGTWVARGNGTTFAIRASLQPATTEDLQTLPEGRRTNGTYRIYTDTALKSVQGNTKNADIIIINGEDYEVFRVMPWQNGLINHYKVLAAKVVAA